MKKVILIMEIAIILLLASGCCPYMNWVEANGEGEIVFEDIDALIEASRIRHFKTRPKGVKMNQIKAEQFKHELIDLLYRCDIKFSDFLDFMKDDKIIKYLAGIEQNKKEFYEHCKKIGFLVE